MQRIGDDFSRSLVLDLLPGALLDRDLYQISLSATLIRSSDSLYLSQTDIQSSFWFTKKDLSVEMGRDVYSLMYTISKVSSGSMFKHIAISKSDLILLNMAKKLVEPSPNS
jgi:hypothetical protein